MINLGPSEFCHLEVKSLVIWTSKVTSFWLRKLGREDVRSCALNVITGQNSNILPDKNFSYLFQISHA